MAFGSGALRVALIFALWPSPQPSAAEAGYYLCRVHSSSSVRTYRSDLFRTTQGRSQLVSAFLQHVRNTYERDAYDAACLGPLVTPEFEGGYDIAMRAFVRQHQGRDIVETLWAPPAAASGRPDYMRKMP